MQKKYSLAVLLVVVLTLAWAAPVSASQISLVATHTLTTNLINNKDNSIVKPTSGTLELYISVYANGDPIERQIPPPYKTYHHRHL